VAGDALNLPFEQQFDCVFTRSCSLYNREEFSLDDAVSRRLLDYVKPGGVFIFDYYSKLHPGKRSETWLYHSMADVRKHFSRLGDARTYFVLRLDAVLLGSLSLTRPWSALAAAASRLTGAGGELVAIVRKP
jgi:SAM-dependent methyltransferase